MVLSDPGLYQLTEWRWKTLVAGVVFGLVLAVVAAGLTMPIWLDALGIPMSIAGPNVTMPSLVWHLVYGIWIGELFPVLEDI